VDPRIILGEEAGEEVAVAAADQVVELVVLGEVVDEDEVEDEEKVVVAVEEVTARTITAKVSNMVM
jgi:hypothetical protein